MIIAIDYKGTWTAAPDLWRDFSHSALQSGHTVIIATARQETGDNAEMDLYGIPDSLPIVFSNGQLKRAACAAAGYQVDVWIDDNPTMIGRRLAAPKSETQTPK